MEREAISERTRETPGHLRSRGYHHGGAPYGFKAVPATDQPCFRVLVENREEQAVLARIKESIACGERLPEIVSQLNRDGIKAPRTEKWNLGALYFLSKRYGWYKSQPHNERPHSDQEVKARITEQTGRGHTYAQIANILNEQKWIPRKGEKFTKCSVGKLFNSCDKTSWQSCSGKPAT